MQWAQLVTLVPLFIPQGKDIHHSLRMQLLNLSDVNTYCHIAIAHFPLRTCVTFVSCLCQCTICTICRLSDFGHRPTCRAARMAGTPHLAYATHHTCNVCSNMCNRSSLMQGSTVDQCFSNTSSAAVFPLRKTAKRAACGFRFCRFALCQVFRPKLDLLRTPCFLVGTWIWFKWHQLLCYPIFNWGYHEEWVCTFDDRRTVLFQYVSIVVTKLKRFCHLWNSLRKSMITEGSLWPKRPHTFTHVLYFVVLSWGTRCPSHHHQRMSCIMHVMHGAWVVQGATPFRGGESCDELIVLVGNRLDMARLICRITLKPFILIILILMCLGRDASARLVFFPNHKGPYGCHHEAPFWTTLLLQDMRVGRCGLSRRRSMSFLKIYLLFQQDGLSWDIQIGTVPSPNLFNRNKKGVRSERDMFELLRELGWHPTPPPFLQHRKQLWTASSIGEKSLSSVNYRVEHRCRANEISRFWTSREWPSARGVEAAKIAALKRNIAGLCQAVFRLPCHYNR